MRPRRLELLSPARNTDTAIQAVLHGADAVYIGPPSHGARKSASNSLEEIERVVDFAHQYRVKVYATVNTIVYESEIRSVETLCRDLYHAGVDALIIQDMGILRMKIPPIALHASTQCDIRTPEKAKFLEEVGFSQLVLARELTLEEIRNITEVVQIPVETFVHGALCVCYSGRCQSSLAVTGRSANRGECAQICRYPYTLTDSSGKVVSRDKYLLSLKDFNTSHNIKKLIEAGVSSFKIEGRLKETGYVKNITALYNQEINNIILESDGQLSRSSYGHVKINFEPKADKSFNRGFTTYFLNNRQPQKISSLQTPKSQGEKIEKIQDLNNGDGISFYDKFGRFNGVNVNRIEGNKIYTARNVDIPKNAQIYRTSDIVWEKKMNSDTGQRKLWLDIKIDNTGISATDERGVAVRKSLDLFHETARNKMNYEEVFKKLGQTPYEMRQFVSEIDPLRFYRVSEITSLRREIISLLDKANKITYPFEYRKPENKKAKYPFTKLDYRDNVSNSLSEKFYREHGVVSIEMAAEISKKLRERDVVMTTRHCILRELDMCKKEKRKSINIRFPLFLNYDRGNFLLDFDCRNCEMKVCLNRTKTY